MRENADKFFKFAGKDYVAWIYYNEDSESGGQYVVNIINNALIAYVIVHYSYFDIFDMIEASCKQYLIDNNDDYFDEVDRVFNKFVPVAEGLSNESLQKVSDCLGGRGK